MEKVLYFIQLNTITKEDNFYDLCRRKEIIYNTIFLSNNSRFIVISNVRIRDCGEIVEEDNYKFATRFLNDLKELDIRCFRYRISISDSTEKFIKLSLMSSISMSTLHTIFQNIQGRLLAEYAGNKGEYLLGTSKEIVNQLLEASYYSEELSIPISELFEETVLFFSDLYNSEFCEVLFKELFSTSLASVQSDIRKKLNSRDKVTTYMLAKWYLRGYISGVRKSKNGVVVNINNTEIFCKNYEDSNSCFSKRFRVIINGDVSVPEEDILFKSSSLSLIKCSEDDIVFSNDNSFSIVVNFNKEGIQSINIIKGECTVVPRELLQDLMSIGRKCFVNGTLHHPSASVVDFEYVCDWHSVLRKHIGNINTVDFADFVATLTCLIYRSTYDYAYRFYIDYLSNLKKTKIDTDYLLKMTNDGVLRNIRLDYYGDLYLEFRNKDYKPIVIPNNLVNSDLDIIKESNIE